MRRLLSGLLLIGILLPSVGATKPPAWDKVVQGRKRFKVLDQFEGRAILDRETGLVWLKFVFAAGFESRWAVAKTFCLGQQAGSRLGFRLPTVYELMSLLEDSGFPRDHPFDGIDTEPAGTYYWSATESWIDINNAVAVDISSGAFLDQDKTTNLPFLCVRGGNDPSGH